MSRIILPLDIDNRNSIYTDDTLKPIMEELERYISDIKYINTLQFSKDVLFSHELQANNSVEGYKDDVETILEVINNVSNIKDPKKKQRIINLYRGYCYIMQGKQINQDNLRELYSILSKELLSKVIGNIWENIIVMILFIFFGQIILIKSQIKVLVLIHFMNICNN